MFLLFDTGIPGGAGIALLGVGFFFIVLAAGFVLFRLLRKSLKMVFRVVIFLVIISIAFVGCSSLLYLGIGNTRKGPVRPERPEPTRQR
jgi:hypothetical protein